MRIQIKRKVAASWWAALIRPIRAIVISSLLLLLIDGFISLIMNIILLNTKLVTWTKDPEFRMHFVVLEVICVFLIWPPTAFFVFLQAYVSDQEFTESFYTPATL